MRNKLGIILLVISLIFSCEDQNIAPIKKDEFKTYFKDYLDGFVKAADLRNFNVNLEGFKVEFVDSLYQDACGIGVKRRPGKPPYVHISRKPRCWTYLTYYQREELIYHEFGHALLRRGHDNDTLPNGERRSIMAQGIWGLTEDPAKKEYYLDELFNRNTPIPEWAY